MKFVIYGTPAPHEADRDSRNGSNTESGTPHRKWGQNTAIPHDGGEKARDHAWASSKARVMFTYRRYGQGYIQHGQTYMRDGLRENLNEVGDMSELETSSGVR